MSGTGRKNRRHPKRRTCARCGTLLDAGNKGLGVLLRGARFGWLCKPCTKGFPDRITKKANDDADRVLP